MVGCDLFDFESKKYVLLVDYYSKYIDVEEISQETTTAVVDALKRVFSGHGIPSILRSDNGPQFTSREFKQFCESYGIQHETSSPHFQSSNGEAERAIQTVKKLWKKTEDKHLALLDYRTTPLPEINLSPAQLLMERRPRNILPSSFKLLEPRTQSPKVVTEHFDSQKQTQKFYYDRRRGVKDLRPLPNGTDVRITNGNNPWAPGVVVSKYDKPRSYLVRSGNRVYRRNRKHIRVASEQANRAYVPEEFTETVPDTAPNPVLPEVNGSAFPNSDRSVSPMCAKPVLSEAEPYVTRSGRSVIKPNKLNL